MSAIASVRKWSLVDLALLVENLAIFLYAWVYFPISRGHQGDFIAMLSHRDNPSGYWNGEGIGYGPIFALFDLALRPLHDMPAMRVMYLVNMLLLAIAFAALYSTFLPAPRSRRDLLVAAFLWLNFYPLTQLLRQNNIEIIELCFLALAYRDLAQQRPVRSGVFYGLAVCTKMIPFVLVVCLAWRRRWRTVAAALATIVVVTQAVLFLKGSSFFGLIRDIAHLSGGRGVGGWANNQALSGLFFRMFAVKDFSTEQSLAYPKVFAPELATTLAVAAAAALVLVGAVAFIRRSGPLPRPAADPLVELTEQQSVLLVTLMGLPYAHTHYFALIVPMYLLAQGRLMRGQLPDSSLTLMGVSYLLLGFLMPLRALDPLVFRYFPASGVELVKLFSLPIAGAVIGYFGLLLLLAQRRPALSSPAYSGRDVLGQPVL